MRRVYRVSSFLASGIFLCWPLAAQSSLSLNDAVTAALATRASLKAEGERVTAAQGLRNQARLYANPDFEFQNENLRPGQTYSRDVDTLALITQPLDILGKRKARIGAANQAVALSQAGYEAARWRVAAQVRLAYWTARGLQEIRDAWKRTADEFQQTVDYHSAQFSAGAIAEQDLLRVRLEQERLRISAESAAIEANRALAELLRQMGRSDVGDLTLTEPLAIASPPSKSEISEILARRADVLEARAAVDQARAKARVEDVAARPDLSLTYGYKRTELPDTTTGVNTALLALKISLPVANRNQGNRAAAEADARRAEQDLAELETQARGQYASAVQEVQLRQKELETLLQPLREHAATIAQIADAAYRQGGTDLLRFLDAERARLDAEMAWTRGMVEYRQSMVRLEAAEGVNP